MPKYLMLDTETVWLNRTVYDVAWAITDGKSIVSRNQFFVKESMQDILSYMARGKSVRFWPDRINPWTTFKNSSPLDEVLASLELDIATVDYVIAHNLAFDIGAVRNTCEKYGREVPDFSQVGQMELSAFFPDFLSADYAIKVPHTLKSGCATFKADHFMPLLDNLKQGHDAAGDVENQVKIFHLVRKHQYTGKKTIYANMLEYMNSKHGEGRFLGPYALSTD